MGYAYQICKNIVLSSVKNAIDKKAVEFLTISLLALYFLNETFVTEKMPTILQDIDIFAEEDTVANIFRKHYPNESYGPKIKNGDTAIDERLVYSEKEKSIKYSVSFILSLRCKDIVKMLEKITHEFICLLRQGKAQISGDKVRFVNGIAVHDINLETGKLTTKNTSLEKGIVQLYTERALKLLSEELEKADVASFPCLQLFKEQIKNYSFSSYAFEKGIIKQLLQYPCFAAAIDKTFSNNNSYPSSFLKEFNAILESSSSFEQFSRNVDSVAKSSSFGDLEGDLKIVQKEIQDTLSLLELKMIHKD